MGVLAVATTTASLTWAIGRLAPGEPGGALLQKGADALAEVLALHHHGLEEKLEVHGLLEGRPGREVDRAPDGPEGGGGGGGPGAGGPGGGGVAGWGAARPDRGPCSPAHRARPRGSPGRAPRPRV